MKSVTLCILLGFIAFYFLDIALRVENLSLEMFAHNLVRFFVGFVFLGIWHWFKHALKFKVALYLILAFLVADDIFDYIRQVNNLSFPMMIHDSLMVIWGALTGFLFVKYAFMSDKVDMD